MQNFPRRIPALVWLPAVFILGGLVGSYGPTEELRTREARAAEEKAKPQSKNAFGSFAELVKIPGEARHPHRPRRGKDASREAETNAVATAAATAGTNAVASSETPADRPRRPSPEDLRARIDEAADLWRARSAVARASALEKLGLDEKGAAAFDEALAAMNDRLRESFVLVAEEIARADSLTPELGVRMMGDLSASLAETYDAIGACAAEERRGDVARLDLVGFVDPSVAEPLISVQDRLEREK